jgi:hypothetical protein
MALRADRLDLDDRSGDWWYLLPLEALGLIKKQGDDQAGVGSTQWL